MSWPPSVGGKCSRACRAIGSRVSLAHCKHIHSVCVPCQRFLYLSGGTEYFSDASETDEEYDEREKLLSGEEALCILLNRLTYAYSIPQPSFRTHVANSKRMNTAAKTGSSHRF
ncbi:hypothetical protein DYB26_015892 [Aphanomyces astaci]|uniref:Uncharacterized protein n=1 Tax=Aphanomyces astaci TaxID=112090 RepID=A0A397EFE0_APHAT|nr:hypothetical protein DYB31_016198 [Aphanomyces astaci]RHZ03748.1 hypothetical protein DYB26_015892 [Aphanomyces astaci]